MSFIGADGPEEFRAIGELGVTATMNGGDDVVVGTDRDDVIDAGAGHDRVDGRGGADTCVGAEVVTGCEQTQPAPPPACDGLPATIVASGTALPVLGTEGPDVIVGTGVQDRIEGMGGDDVICAVGGADLVDAGPGNDRVFAGDDGVDETYLLGDHVVPGPGDDRIDLGVDARRVSGWVGSGEVVDYSTSESAITTDMTPADGTFTVTGQGTDTITTQAGLELWGSPLADVITGGPGEERIVGFGGDDVVDGAGGDDEVYGDKACGRMFCADDTPADHDVVRGGDGNDTVAGGFGPDELDGGAGNDVVTARQSHGARSVLGGPGQDWIVVQVRGAMHVDVDGGPDEDSLVVEAAAPLPAASRMVVDAARGRVVSSAVGPVATMRAFEAYELASFSGRPRLSGRFRFRFVGSDASESVRVSTGLLSLRARMLGGDDVVTGSNQDDVIDGGAGFDRVRALGGSDRCIDVEVAHGCELHRAAGVRASP
jgi:Ca2+-binding RTX toxin-like protein